MTLKALTKLDRVKKLAHNLGPGFVTGAADDDPSGIVTYAQAGARFGYGFLWATWLTLPLIATVQYLCAKLALVTGCGIAGNLRRYYPPWITYAALIILFVANIVTAGANLGAVGAGINLLFPLIPIHVAIIPCTLVLLTVQIFGSYDRINSILKYLCLSLLAYIAAAFLVHADPAAVLKATLLPEIKFNQEYLEMLVAVLGTTISPYLFFWQATHEVEKQRDEGKKTVAQRQGTTAMELKEAALDVNFGMLYSNVVMFFIMVTTGATLFVQGGAEITSAQQAAVALRPLAGQFATVLFAIGIIGTGFLSIPILTASAAYGVSELFGWKRDINAKPWLAPEFYTTIVAGTLSGLLLNFADINPMRALVLASILSGLLAPPLMVMIMLISRRKDIMGNKTNSLPANILGWTATVVMTLAAFVLILSWF